MQDENWFIERIGKRIYREKVNCDCDSCILTGKNGLIIADKDHALYLELMANELNIKYFDKL